MRVKPPSSLLLGLSTTNIPANGPALSLAHFRDTRCPEVARLFCLRNPIHRTGHIYIYIYIAEGIPQIYCDRRDSWHRDQVTVVVMNEAAELDTGMARRNCHVQYRSKRIWISPSILLASGFFFFFFYFNFFLLGCKWVQALGSWVCSFWQAMVAVISNLAACIRWMC